MNVLESYFLKGRVIGWMENGASCKEIENLFGIPKSTVYDWWVKFEETKCIIRKNGSGRPKKFSQRGERHLKRLVKQSDSGCATKISKKLQAVQNITVPKSTLYDILHRQGLVTRSKIPKPNLNTIHISNRLQYARNHVLFTVNDWSRVLFTDEVKVNLHGSDGNYRYWIDKEEIKANCVTKQAIIPKEKYGGGSIQIWACFGFCGVGFFRKYDRMNSKLYVKVLADEMMKSVNKCIPEKQRDNWLLLHDGAGPHTANIVKDWLTKNKVNTVSHPSKSPDLNPIENLWAICKRKLYEEKRCYNTKKDLFLAFSKIFNAIKPELCQSLVASMPNRMKKVISAIGKNIQF